MTLRSTFATLATLAALLLGLSLGACRRPEVLRIEDLVPGTGAEAQVGRLVAVRYTAKLLSGIQVDSSAASGKPTEFVLGQGMVIPGWEQGIVGMRVGGKRRLTVPPSLAYGKRGGGPAIPPGSTLIFEIELAEAR